MKYELRIPAGDSWKTISHHHSLKAAQEAAKAPPYKVPAEAWVRCETGRHWLASKSIGCGYRRRMIIRRMDSGTA